jgi:hypothetical protein
MVLVYLPTKLGDLCWANMEHIYDIWLTNINKRQELMFKFAGQMLAVF